MTPHLAEEAWAAIGETGLIAEAEWSVADPALLVADSVTIAVQVKGKLRDTVEAPAGASKDELEALALASENARRAIGDAPIRKVIVVPGRLVNIVA